MPPVNVVRRSSEPAAGPSLSPRVPPSPPLTALGLCLLLLATAACRSAGGPAAGPPRPSPAGDTGLRYRLADATIVLPAGAGATERLAAEELRRYVWLLTGVRPGIVAVAPDTGPAIRVLTGPGAPIPPDGPDPSQNFALAVTRRSPVVQEVRGASPAATLWAAYTLVETWGAGFYLGGDALPPADRDRDAAAVERACRPAFAVRGNLPWLNFLNSPTTWNLQDYRTFFEQMAKQKANFIGFHAYDHEPFCAYDVTPAGAKMGGPLMTTISPHRWWSPHAMSTREHLFGTDLFFDRGEWGCEAGIEDGWANAPGRAVRVQQAMMAEALAFARERGIRACIGFEVTGDPDDAGVRRELERRMSHVLATYPLDYLWIWQSEGRGTGDRIQQAIAVEDDIRAAFDYLPNDPARAEAARIAKFVRLAHETLGRLAPRVRLVVSGWGGDAWMRFSSLYPGLDKTVPPDVIFAALDNIDPGLQPHVSEEYGRLAPSRERWPIPWFESDGGHTRMDQTGPQTNVTPFEPLLKDALAKGCQGALGIHWRTRNVEDVAGYLYRFGWEPDLTTAEFFRRYAADQYGVEHAEELANIHLRLEDMGPQLVGAAGCVECSTPFQWFVAPPPQTSGWKPNRAGPLPDPARFPELEAIAARLGALETESQAAGRAHAAARLHDLRGMIRWLVGRARTGLAIWNADAPLEAALRRAEKLRDEGRRDEARRAAEQTLRDLEALDFRGALQSLAETCRTRGELGMLATANARYGRFYASFLARLAAVLDRPLPGARGPGPWLEEPRMIVYPAPARVPAGAAVAFDAVLPSAATAAPRRLVVTLRGLDGAPDAVLPLVRLGGAYHRASFAPDRPGEWLWRVEAVTADGTALWFPAPGDPARPLAVGEAGGN